MLREKEKRKTRIRFALLNERRRNNARNPAGHLVYTDTYVYAFMKLRVSIIRNARSMKNSFWATAMFIYGTRVRQTTRDSYVLCVRVCARARFERENTSQTRKREEEKNSRSRSRRGKFIRVCKFMLVYKSIRRPCVGGEEMRRSFKYRFTIMFDVYIIYKYVYVKA